MALVDTQRINIVKRIFDRLPGPFIIEDIKNYRGELVIPGIITIANQFLETENQTITKEELELILEKLYNEEPYVRLFLGKEKKTFCIHDEGEKKTFEKTIYYNKVYRKIIQEKNLELKDEEINYLFETLTEHSISCYILIFLKSQKKEIWENITEKIFSKNYPEKIQRIWDDILNTRIDQRTNLEIGNLDKNPFENFDENNLEEIQENINKRIKSGVFSVSGIRQIFSSFFDDKPLPLRFPWRLGIDTKPTFAAKIHAATQAKLFVEMLENPESFAKKIPKSAISAKNAVEQEKKYDDIKRDFIKFIEMTQKGKTGKKIAILHDTRSTGPELADTDIRILQSLGKKIEYGFVGSVCEIAVYVKENPDIQGGIYISASHNDEGYNGIKLFLGDGRIMPEAVAYPYIFILKKHLEDMENTKETIIKIKNADSFKITEIYNKIPIIKNKFRQADWKYRDKVITGCIDDTLINNTLKSIYVRNRSLKLGIIIDPNGGAREDREYFERLGFKVYEINQRPRYDMNHQLCPSTTAVEETNKDLESIKNKADKEGFLIIGSIHYDTDGDRRNFRPIDNTGKFYIRDDMVQICFALDVLSYVLSEENWDYEKNIPKKILGISCNDATAVLLEQLAEIFGFIILRTQTGESNVVDGMERLSKLTMDDLEKIEYSEDIFFPKNIKKIFNEKFNDQKIKIIIGGEGSNGSDFTQNLLVRDPLHTIRAIVNFLNPSTGMKIVKTMLTKINKIDDYNENWWSKEDISILIHKLINYLPMNKTTDFFTTGGPGEMVNPPLLPGLVKDNFDKAFEEKKEVILKKLFDIWKQYNIENLDFEYVNYEEKAKIGIGKRNKTVSLGRQIGDGGYKIRFSINLNKKKYLIAWIWFRDSITEKGLTRTGASVVFPIEINTNIENQKDTILKTYFVLKEELGNVLKESVKITIKQTLEAQIENIQKELLLYKEFLKSAKDDLKGAFI